MIAFWDLMWDYLWGVQVLWLVLLPFILIIAAITAAIDKLRGR